MAVEIKELVIRVGIEYPAYSGASKEETTQNEPPRLENEEALVNACVKQVLKILKQQQKR